MNKKIQDILELENKVKAIVAKNSNENIAIEHINEKIRLIEDLGYDSIQLITMIVDLETDFNIMFEDEDLEVDKLNKVNNLIDIIKEKCK